MWTFMLIIIETWLNKKDTTPSKSSPHQWRSCWNLVLYFPPDWLSPIREEYVAKITPFFTLPLCFEEILPYLNWWIKTFIKKTRLRSHRFRFSIQILWSLDAFPEVKGDVWTAVLTLFREWTWMFFAPISRRSLSASYFKSFETLNLKSDVTGGCVKQKPSKNSQWIHTNN